MKKSKKTYDKALVDDMFRMMKHWLDTDVFKAGAPWNYIEKKDEAYARGYRQALYSVLKKAEEWLQENYIQ